MPKPGRDDSAESPRWTTGGDHEHLIGAFRERRIHAIGLRATHDCTLAHGGPYFPNHTGIVHISGITDTTVTLGQMTDAHRVLVDGADRLGNIEQIAALRALGYTGPISFEAFATEVHALPDPGPALRASIDLIETGLS